MPTNLIDPQDSLERQNEKLLKIVDTLMRRAEQRTEASGEAYAQFQRAVILEDEVRLRTRELERALDLLNESNAKLAEANAETEAARANLANAIETVEEGFALFNANDELVMSNSRFGQHMLDIYDKLKPGLKFETYVHLVANSPYLSLPDSETPNDWETYRMARHKDKHAVFNARMAGARWLQVSEHRMPDGGTVILQTDITDMMRLERQERDRLLDDQAQLIKATLEHLNQGVCIFDDQDCLVGRNRRLGELLSIPTHRLQIGTHFSSLYEQVRRNARFLNQTDPEVINAWVAKKSARAPLSFELGIDHDRILAVFAQQMPDKGFVISFTDVSAERAAVRAMGQVNEMLEQRVAERTLDLEDALSEAERANASKSRFVAAASHDLLQPLSAAKLYVASLESDLESPDLQARLSSASNALVSVESILSALLDISKLDSGLASVDVSTIDLNDMLTQIRDELDPQARQRGLDFRVVPCRALVDCDASYLRRILQNLVSNAIRYTETGKVLIGIRHRKASVRLEVWDTGPGIPEDQQNKVFDEFHRLNASASPSEGMGLGLAIVERACRLLNLPLHLTSEVGRGTCFSVELPRSSADQMLKPPEFRARNAVALDHHIAVLIENDDALRSALTIIMENWGLDVLPCASQREAEEVLAEVDIAPDVIVADYRLDNDALGTDAIAALRQRHGDVPACLVTADREGDLHDLCARQSVTLMHKPIDPDSLRTFFEQALSP